MQSALGRDGSGWCVTLIFSGCGLGSPWAGDKRWGGAAFKGLRLKARPAAGAVSWLGAGRAGSCHAVGKD